MRLLLRCDGGPGIGVGHVVRCLAIAEEAASRGHEVALLGRLEGPFLQGLAAEVGPGLTLLGPSSSDDAADLARAAAGYDVLHLDHYDLPEGILDALEEQAQGAVDPVDPAPSGARRPLLSNLTDGRYGARPADLLVDPTVDAEWSEPPATARWHLRGARFVALRRSVTDLRDPDPGSGAGPQRARLQVLVVMGGADPAACAPVVVDALAATGAPLDVTVVATEQTRAPLDERARAWNGHLQVTDPRPDLPTEMARADLVVTAAGTSVWELCAMARPMAVVAVVENQVPGYRALLRAGAAVGLGDDPPLDGHVMTSRLAEVLGDRAGRIELATAAGRVVDGLGSWRLVQSFEAIVAGAATGRSLHPVEMRAATMDDAELLWRWRNDAATRENSRAHDPVPLDAHLGWLRASLDRDDRHLLVGVAGGEPVGTIRWDREVPGEWEVSITVAPESRGRGLAASLLAAGERWLSDHSGEDSDERSAGVRRATAVAAYIAGVHTANVASRRLFLGGGYLPDLPADDQGFERFVKLGQRQPPHS